MVAVMFSIACALSLTAAVFLQLIMVMSRQNQTIASGPRAECDEGDITGCPTGTTCAGGSCVAIPALETCQVGDSCEVSGAGCRCQAPLRCQANVCTADTTTASCDDPIVHRVLVEVQKTCQGSLQNCPEDKLKDFVIKSAEFDQVLAAFPGTMTVHFPSGRPVLADPSGWPSEDEEAHYRKQLSTPAVTRALRDAQDLLLIGRSSKSTNENLDLQFSKARVSMVTKLLTDVAASPDESTALRGKIRQMLLGGKKVLAPDFFLKHYANRIVAWSTGAEQNLRAKIADITQLSPKDRAAILGQMNQVVFIVPIPCKLPVEGAAAGPPGVTP